jgi:hypothetical protein
MDRCVPRDRLPGGAARATQAYADRAAGLGVAIRLGTDDTMVEGRSRPGVQLADGTRLAAGAVVVAAGRGHLRSSTEGPGGRPAQWGVVV